MRLYCIYWLQKSRKNVFIWKRKRSCSIKTMHGCKSAQFRWPPVTFFTSKLEKMARRTAVHVQHEVHRPNRCLFWRPSEILLFERLKKVGETLGKVYRVKRRLCWKVKKNLHKIICFLYLSPRTYWTARINEKSFTVKNTFLNYFVTIGSLLFNKMNSYSRSIDSSQVNESFMFLHQFWIMLMKTVLLQTTNF